MNSRTRRTMAAAVAAEVAVAAAAAVVEVAAVVAATVTVGALLRLACPRICQHSSHCPQTKPACLQAGCVLPSCSRVMLGRSTMGRTMSAVPTRLMRRGVRTIEERR